ncbi:hypothetical protein UPYG_G00245270 [Umbra pygmaea]|uniref:Uncharacterized protein n=1 Tax=Umbra pygmaea TaxID=75934 RepID=A0ABD0WYF1_UMBPY
MMGLLKLLSALLLLSLLPTGLFQVVNKFSDVPQCEGFFLDLTPNIPDIFVAGDVQNTRYKPICQFFETMEKKILVRTYTFATLYDTDNKIPVFSAYTFTGTVTEGPTSTTWVTEPDLEDDEQAVNADYKGKKDILDKGHLFPCLFAPSAKAKTSTYILTNTVPQVSSFNRNEWKTMEGRIKNLEDDEELVESHEVLLFCII